MSEKNGTLQPPSKIHLWLLHDMLLTLELEGWGWDGEVSLNITIQRRVWLKEPVRFLNGRVMGKKKKKGSELSPSFSWKH